MQSITKDFPGVRALDDVSFEVRPGEIHALCGENGAGKSTLIKILGGVYPYGTYEGELHINGNEQQFHTVRDAERAGIAIIHQELALIPEMTVAENIYLGKEPCQFGTINKHRLYHEAGELLSQFGLTIPLRKPVHELGIGQQQLVEIAKALGRSLQAHIQQRRSLQANSESSGSALLLVLDEPTAALTESEVDILREILTQLREKGVACIYITHKLKEIFQIADRVTVLRDGKTVATQSIKSSECTEDALISQMVGRELTALFPKRRTVSIDKNRSNRDDVALRVENLSTYPSEPPQLENINFEVRRGEILGIAGLMGAGRTELISTIFGVYEGRWRGEIVIEDATVNIHSPREAIQHGIALVSEDRKRYGLLLDVDVVRNMTLASLGPSSDITSHGIIDDNTAFEKSEHYVDSLQIKTTSLEVPVNHLSGGNQQKVVLGKWLMTHPTVLFLDEPTRGIDVGAKAEIHTLMAKLAQEGVAIVFVSSELPEILGMSDRVIVLHAGKITGEFINENLTQEDILRCAAGTSISKLPSPNRKVN
ncbi:ATP-binding cassette domain-containing protein [Candidatus Poribacteria bacterium]|nr:ATP-binding cassette domain-containing protein [Candidatus Poribacteria bacterium]MYA56612.1 ATP-binding cassette domain-containing protein [Candidatus Poribacteria bacterium]